MIQYQRRQEILKLLGEEHSLKIKDIAKKIFASESSVRRDLEELEKEGYIHRVYGGAVLAEEKNDALPLKLRDSQNSSKKSLIAKKASDLIFDGAVIIMDSSSTVRRMAKYVTRFKNLKIVTNSLNLLAELDEASYTIYCTGGKLNKNNNVFVGSSAID
ncbi:MAG: DeoR/GlpR transcriptional regulator, partial [Clostridia bacterium]|nr:DeoR/GlpR transcriptional regulator [Clostridia bacterium]